MSSGSKAYHEECDRQSYIEEVAKCKELSKEEVYKIIPLVEALNKHVLEVSLTYAERCTMQNKLNRITAILEK
jgi:hypothetical protein